MATYTKTTDFLAKDSLPLNNAGKYVKGSEIDTEFNNLATADADNLKVSALGTGVETALGVNIGSAGAPVVNGGALGTPSSGTLTNATGLPAAGVTGTALVAAAIGTTVQAYDATLTAFAGGLTAAGKIPYATALNTLGELDFKDEDDMVSDSATAVPSQQSVKAYVTSSVAGGLPTTGGSMTGPINEARGSLAMHATTMDLWAQPNIIDGTSSAVTITAIANAPQAGARRVLYPVAASVITNGATFAVDGAANATAAAGDAWEFEAVTVSTFKVHITKADGTAVVGAATAWTDYSATSTIVGWSSYTTKSIYYKDIGKTRFVTFILYGTSNSTSASFTLPSASSNTVSTNNGIRVIDNSAEGAIGLIGLPANSSTVTCYKSLLSTWTNSGDKLVAGQFFYDLP